MPWISAGAQIGDAEVILFTGPRVIGISSVEIAAYHELYDPVVRDLRAGKRSGVMAVAQNDDSIREV